jgi:hypothetical protein
MDLSQERTDRRPRHVALVIGALLLAGCAMTGGTLGGRETCWPDSDRRAPSIWRGVLRADGAGFGLATPEGEVIPLAPGDLAFGQGALVRGSEIVVRVGDDVTLFGGAGADGFLVVCAVEERHSSA